MNDIHRVPICSSTNRRLLTSSVFPVDIVIDLPWLFVNVLFSIILYSLLSASLDPIVHIFDVGRTISTESTTFKPLVSLSEYLLYLLSDSLFVFNYVISTYIVVSIVRG